MARWKLMASAYLNTSNPVEWEYNETDRASGRPRRTRLQVPRYLDVKDPGDWTQRWGQADSANVIGNEDGCIVVCTPGTGQGRDIEFIGDPTPDMVPLDAEAEAITARFEEHWRYKPDGGPISYSQSMVDEFKMEMVEKEVKPQQVEIAGLGDLVGAIAAMAKQNAELLASITASSQPRRL